MKQKMERDFLVDQRSIDQAFTNQQPIHAAAQIPTNQQAFNVPPALLPQSIYPKQQNHQDLSVNVHHLYGNQRPSADPQRQYSQNLNLKQGHAAYQQYLPVSQNQPAYLQKQHGYDLLLNQRQSAYPQQQNAQESPQSVLAKVNQLLAMGDKLGITTQSGSAPPPPAVLSTHKNLLRCTQCSETFTQKKEMNEKTLPAKEIEA
jgi:hypothetical protein